jgi:hypothetical protein
MARPSHDLTGRLGSGRDEGCFPRTPTYWAPHRAEGGRTNEQPQRLRPTEGAIGWAQHRSNRPSRKSGGKVSGFKAGGRLDRRARGHAKNDDTNIAVIVPPRQHHASDTPSRGHTSLWPEMPPIYDSGYPINQSDPYLYGYQAGGEAMPSEGPQTWRYDPPPSSGNIFPPPEAGGQRLPQHPATYSTFGPNVPNLPMPSYERPPPPSRINGWPTGSPTFGDRSDIPTRIGNLPHVSRPDIANLPPEISPDRRLPNDWLQQQMQRDARGDDVIRRYYSGNSEGWGNLIRGRASGGKSRKRK